MSSISGYLFLMFFLIVSTGIQILFKHIALGPGGKCYLYLLLDPLFSLCVLLFLAQTTLWLSVLKRLPLSKAYPYTSLTLVTLLISGALFFKEHISWGNVLGALIIMTGVVVLTGARNNQ